MFSDCRLVIFTRYPIPGKSKTRLIPLLGAEGAANHQKMMTEFIVNQAKQAGVSIEVRFTDGTEEQMRGWLGSDISFKHQGEGDLGERMSRAISENLNHDLKKVAIIGSDCPDFRSAEILNLFKTLEEHPVVIGPATDGGYYTIGMNVLHQELFHGIDWGTENVLAQTLKASKIKIHLLETLSDVDEPNDLSPSISVIIPTLNEERTIEKTIASAQLGFNTEIIVVDGGSTDATCTIATQMNVRVVKSEQGRGIQLQKGVEHSKGEIIVFLHADTNLPYKWDISIRNAFKNKKIALTAFQLRINDAALRYRLVEWGTKWRSLFLALPYGDQAFAVKRSVLSVIGGVPSRMLLEDVYLLRKIRKLGKIKLLKDAVLTSSRRWKKFGVVKTTLYNQFIMLADFLGASDDALKKLYYEPVSTLALLRFCGKVVFKKV